MSRTFFTLIAAAALSLAAAPDFWQHAIHANAHILSAVLGAAHLWLLVRWWRSGQDGWLAAFAAKSLEIEIDVALTWTQPRYSPLALATSLNCSAALAD